MSPSKVNPEVAQGTTTSEPSKMNSKYNIYLLEVFPSEAVRYCQSLFHTVLPDDPEVHNWKENADSILVREKIISAEDINNACKLRAIGKQGTGIDIIDKEACDAKGIPVCNTPGVNAQSVAELVLTLTMAVARQIRTITTNQAAGLEVRKEHCTGTTLAGKTMGIIGMGAIGTKVARIFRGAFDAFVYAYDPFAPADAWSDIPHARVNDFEDMLPHVDVLTVHVPLNQETRGMLSMPQFRKMKPSTILINCARHGIVNEVDLIEALNQGLIWGAGLDCHEEEPPTLARYSALWSTGKVISTPHIGGTTAETQVKTARAAMDRVFEFLSSH